MNQLQQHLVKAAAILVAMAAFGGSAAGRDALRVRSEARVVREAVCLADVADIVTDNEELGQRLRPLVVMTFTEGVTQAEIGAFDIHRALAQAGLQPALLDVYGASYCTVSRETDAPAQPQTEENKRTGGQPTKPSFGEMTAPKGGGSEISEGSLSVAAALEALVKKAAPCEEKRLKVEWEEGDAEYLAQRYEAGQFEIRPRSRVGLGEVCFEVRSRDGEGNVQRRLVEAKVWCVCEMAIAQRTINAGETIGAKDITMTAMQVTDLREAGLQDAAAVVGQAARRTLRAQQVIKAGDLMKVLLVRRNDLVEVSAQVGSVSVHRQAIALADGGLGETISVRDKDNRIVIQGQITGPGMVAVRESETPPTTADEPCFAGEDARLSLKGIPR